MMKYNKFGIKEICANDLLTRINTLELYLCMINSAQAIIMSMDIDMKIAGLLMEVHRERI